MMHIQMESFLVYHMSSSRSSRSQVCDSRSRMNNESNGSSAPGGSRSIVSKVVEQLENVHDFKELADAARRERKKGQLRLADTKDDCTKPTTLSLVTHLHPTECTTIIATMKAIINGFVGRQNDENCGDLLRRESSVCS